MAGCPAASIAQNGSLSFGYQRLELRGQVFRPDGTAIDTTFIRSFWTQNYLATVSRRFGDQFYVAVQGRYNRQQFIDRNERMERPYGQFRLIHPVVGLFASFQPSIATQQISQIGSGGGVVDTGAVRTVSSRSEQSVVSAYLSPPKLPRLDLSWIRRYNAADELSSEDAQSQRTARLAWTAGPVSVRAGYGDVARAVGTAEVGAPDQRYYDAGFAIGLSPVKRSALNVDYGVRRFERGMRSESQTRTLSHSLSVSGSYRQTSTLSWSTSYLMHQTVQTIATENRFTDHDAQVGGSWRPNKVFGLHATGGARTLRIGVRNDLQRYASSTASLSGRVLEHWTADASASQSFSWNPDAPMYASTLLRTSSRWRLRQGLDASGHYYVSINGDTAGDHRVVTQWAGMLSLQPWRSLRVRINASYYRVEDGPTSGGASQSRTLDVRWAPLRTFELLANLTTSGVPPNNDPKTTSTTLTAQWSPLPPLNVSTNYVSTSSARANALSGLVSGRDAVTTRVTWAPDRRSAFSISATVVDPNRGDEARQYDASYTHRFGR